jgi:cyanophycin synthetase
LFLQNYALGLAGTARDAALPSLPSGRTPLTIGQVGSSEVPGVYPVAVAYDEEELGRACLEVACSLCRATLNDTGLELQAELRRLRTLAEDVCLGPWLTGPLVAAARRRGIPFCRLDGASLVQLGHGARRQRILTSSTERTGRIAEWISIDKDLTKRLLSELGLPVPAGRPVRSAEDAWAAALELGLPVVVKPRNADYGLGVSLNLSSQAQVFAAYEAARQHRDDVLVEQYVRGDRYRVMVIGEKLMAAVRLDVLRLTADGCSTVTELIERANQDPRRSEDGPWNRITTDEETRRVLAEQGLSLDLIPPAGMEVAVRHLSYSAEGSPVIDVTDVIHPLVAADCVSAVRLLGLELAGLDVLAQDIRRPLNEQGGAIVEVNAQPTLCLHFPPLCDRYQPVCEAIVELLFPSGQTGRVPLAAITGRGDNAACGRWLTHLLQGTGQRVGWASSAGLYLDERRLKPGDQANLAGGRALLLCPEVEAAVLELSPDSIRSEGLGWDRCDVALVTRLGRTASSGADPTDVESEMTQAVRVLVDAITPSGAMVAVADDPAALALTAAHPGRVFLVAACAEHPAIAGTRRPGCHAVFFRGGDVVLAAAGGAEQLIPVDVRRVAEADDEPTAEALLAAVAAAWALQVPVETLRARLSPAA